MQSDTIRIADVYKNFNENFGKAELPYRWAKRPRSEGGWANSA
jgi:hypothetical protein